ncbi:hypothetical protein DFS33DRAFT_1384825 [Desarmillaria ectypa]|nr:hypothetical protein DFS33DRAFT_1384825 [Desarmillaria ectypa]
MLYRGRNIQGNEGSTTALCPTIGDDPLSHDFTEYFGYPLRRLYVNGLRVNFEDKVKILEGHIAILGQGNQRLPN